MILLIKKYRINKNITLKSLATLSECSYSYLNELENNKKKNPGIDIIERVGHALEICPISLMGGCRKTICTPGCYYYTNQYIDKYKKLPPRGRKKLEKLMALSKNIDMEYKDYLV